MKHKHIGKRRMVPFAAAMRGCAAACAFTWLGFAPIANAGPFDLQYLARTGDLNSDGRTDIYLDYRPELVAIPLNDLMIVIPMTTRQVGDFVLQQNSAGGFDLVTNVTASQVTTMRQWAAASSIRPVACDVNSDGVQDLVVTKIASTIPGAQDVIAFASSATGGPPMAVKAMDASVTQFVTDVNGFFADPGHYYDNAFRQAGLVVPWPVNVYDCGSYGLEYYYAGDPYEIYAYLDCMYVYSFIDSLVFDVDVLDITQYSVPAFYTNAQLYPYLTAVGDVTIPADTASAVTQEISVLLGTQVAPVVVPEDVPVKLPPLPPTPPPADIPVPPPRPIWETIFRLGPRAGILIAAILTPSETRDFESFIHYSYLEQRFSILSGLRNGAWAAKPPVLSGARAQQVYALPIHDQDDLPPDTYFQLWLIDGFPKQVKIETIPTIVTNTQYGLVRTREGGGVSYRLLAPVPPGMISGPFDLPN